MNMPMHDDQEVTVSDGRVVRRQQADTSGTYRAKLILTGPQSVTEIELTDSYENPLEAEITIESCEPWRRVGDLLTAPSGEVWRWAEVRLTGRVARAQWRKVVPDAAQDQG